MPEFSRGSAGDGMSGLKEQAAARGVEEVASGMVVGLGHGSTALEAVRALARRLEAGELSEVRAVPCSRQTEAEARRLGIPLTTLEEHPVLDLTLDGADEVAPNLDVIKGGGGGLLREKIVAQASQREIILVDEAKLSPKLGTRFPVPIEVLPFGWLGQRTFLEALGARVSLRLGPDGTPYETDQGNLVLDCHFGPIADARKLSDVLASRAGIIEHGLFLDLVTEVVVAGKDGIRILRRA